MKKHSFFLASIFFAFLVGASSAQAALATCPTGSVLYANQCYQNSSVVPFVCPPGTAIGADRVSTLFGFTTTYIVPQCVPTSPMTPSPVAATPSPAPTQSQLNNTGTQSQPNPFGTQSQPNATGITLVNPLGANSNLTTLLTSVLGFVVKIGAIVVVLMLVYVGYLFVIAQGNESKLTEAKKALLWTVIGALILLGAQAIAMAIQATVTALGTGT